MGFRKDKELRYKFPFHGGPLDKLICKAFLNTLGNNDECDEVDRLVMRAMLVVPLLLLGGFIAINMLHSNYPNLISDIWENGGSTIAQYFIIWFGLVVLVGGVTVPYALNKNNAYQDSKGDRTETETI